MTSEQLQNVLGLCEAKLDGDWYQVPEGRHLTVHLSLEGVGLTVNRIVRVQLKGEQAVVHTSRDETYVFIVGDAFACAFEDKETQQTRKAGFV